TVGLTVRGIRCHDPYSKWLGDVGTNSKAGVVARLFWRRIPLQTDAVRALVRAAAAALLPRLNEWHLFPARPWLTTAGSLAGAGLLPIPSNYVPAANLVGFRRLLPNDKFSIQAGISSEARVTEEDVYAVERTLQWACDFLEADALVFLPSHEAEE